MTTHTNTLKLQKVYYILFLAIPFVAMAQESTPGGGDTQDVPIDNYLLVTKLLGIYVAYRLLKPNTSPKQLNN